MQYIVIPSFESIKQIGSSSTSLKKGGVEGGGKLGERKKRKRKQKICISLVNLSYEGNQVELHTECNFLGIPCNHSDVYRSFLFIWKSDSFEHSSLAKMMQVAWCTQFEKLGKRKNPTCYQKKKNATLQVRISPLIISLSLRDSLGRGRKFVEMVLYTGAKSSKSNQRDGRCSVGH